jgi:hypothetical protein
MKELIKKERCDQHKITMIVSCVLILFLLYFMVFINSYKNHLNCFFLLVCQFFDFFLEPFFNIIFHWCHIYLMMDFDVE